MKNKNRNSKKKVKVNSIIRIILIENKKIK